MVNTANLRNFELDDIANFMSGLGETWSTSYCLGPLMLMTLYRKCVCIACIHSGIFKLHNIVMYD